MAPDGDPNGRKGVSGNELSQPQGIIRGMNTRPSRSLDAKHSAWNVATWEIAKAWHIFSVTTNDNRQRSRFYD